MTVRKIGNANIAKVEEIEFDFHTEPAGKGAAGSESFEKGTASAGRGSYRARYPGIHGWYWRNPTRNEVTVRLVTAGFYTEARQFREDGTTRSKYLDDVTEFEHLPPAAQDYVRFVEGVAGVPVSYIAVGPSREQTVVLPVAA